MNDDPRLEHLEIKDKIKSLTEIFCWPDDEGIRLNNGRPGAALAPAVILQYLKRLTPPLDSNVHPRFSIHDFQLPVTEELSIKHRLAETEVFKSFKNKNSILTLGGGHDYGYPDAAAFLNYHLQQDQNIKPLVINFDAHLDVRPTHKGFNSGTPFRRLLEKFHGQFDFVEIGLQRHCNSREHAQWAQGKGAKLYTVFDVLQPAFQSHFSQSLSQRPCWVSLDIDVITSRSAPGCSQSWDTGLESEVVRHLLELIDQKTNWLGLGIYEVSPPLDFQNTTSKLAALFAYDFILRRSKT